MRICFQVLRTILRVGIYEKEAQTKRNKHKKITCLPYKTKQRKKIIMEHLRALSLLFFAFAYLCSLAMFCESALFLKFGGIALFVFLTHELVQQYYLKK